MSIQFKSKLHAAVFWGFLALATVSTVYFAFIK